MKRVALAILGVVVAVALIVTIARESSDGKPPPPPSRPTLAGSASAPDADRDTEGGETDDVELEVKELSFGDGGENQRSIRVEHPSIQMQQRLRDWLEPRETAAVATHAPIDCHALLARTSLVSVVCVTMATGDYDAGTDAATIDAGDPAARYEAITLRPVNGEIKELALADVLIADGGEGDAIAACKKAADPPLPCAWPPTTFAVGLDGALFLCHDSHCVTIDGDANVVRPELR